MIHIDIRQGARGDEPSPDVLLSKYATRADDGCWWFSDPTNTHSAENALAIVETCQFLGVPVDDRVPATAWLRLVRKVAELERAVGLSAHASTHAEMGRKMARRGVE